MQSIIVNYKYKIINNCELELDEGKTEGENKEYQPMVWTIEANRIAYI